MKSTKLILNGESFPEFNGSTISDLVEQLKFSHYQIAVEVNEELIPREYHSNHQLSENDKVEIVSLVGGG